MDKEMYLQAKLGNKDAIQKVLNDFEGLIIKQCNMYKLKGHSFEDLKQIAYSSVLEGLNKIKIENIDTAPAYIIICIKNSLRNEARKILSKPESDSLNSVNDSGIEYIDTLISDYSIENDVINNMSVNDVIDGYNKLSSEEKDILSYYVVNPYGGLKEYSLQYKKDYRHVRYMKDCIIKKIQKLI